MQMKYNIGKGVYQIKPKFETCEVVKLSDNTKIRLSRVLIAKKYSIDIKDLVDLVDKIVDQRFIISSVYTGIHPNTHEEIFMYKLQFYDKSFANKSFMIEDCNFAEDTLIKASNIFLWKEYLKGGKNNV